MSARNIRQLALLAVLSVLLAACGGGGESAPIGDSAPRATCGGAVRASNTTGHEHVCVVYPLPDAQAVPVAAQLFVKFGRDMLPSSVDPGTVRVLDAVGDPVALSEWAYNQQRRDLLLKPVALAYGATYTVKVTDAVSDLSGGIVPYQWSFTTESGNVSYPVGGSVSGLIAGAVTLGNGSDTVTVSAGSASFVFPAEVAHAGRYDVRVVSDPPGQVCTVGRGSGTVVGAAVSDVQVSCTAQAYAIGGSVSGLTVGELLLRDQISGQETTVVAGADSFAFAQPMAFGASYDVRAVAPAGLTCLVARGTGTVGAGDVADIAVTCAANGYRLGGTIVGLLAPGLVLSNGGETLAVAAGATTFEFAVPVAHGASYDVQIAALPFEQTCTLSDNSGSVDAADVSNVVVSCWQNGYPIGGTISGLSADGLVLRLNPSGQTLVLNAGANGFQFPDPVAHGDPYSVVVDTQPTGPTCSVLNGFGTVAGAVSNVAVLCSGGGYSLGGTVDGLSAGSLVLRDTISGETVTVTDAEPDFMFVQPRADGIGYNVVILSQPAGISCLVSAGTGAIAGADVNDIDVSCVPLYAIDGTANNLNAALQLREALSGRTVDLAAGASSFSFGRHFDDGSLYEVQIVSQPVTQSCTLDSEVGEIVGNDALVSLDCVDLRSLGGTISNLGGEGLRLQEEYSGSVVTVPSGATSFVFPDRFVTGSDYAVTIEAQPDGYSCTLGNDTGAVPAWDSNDIVVTCSELASGAPRLKVRPGPFSANVLWEASGAESVEVLVSEDTFATFDTCSGSPSCKTWSVTPHPLYYTGFNTRFNDSPTPGALPLNKDLIVRLRANYPGGISELAPAELYRAPAPRFAYVLSERGASIAAYAIDSDSGLLTALGYEPVPQAQAVTAMVSAPKRNLLFVTGTDTAGKPAVWVFSPDDGTGQPVYVTRRSFDDVVNVLSPLVIDPDEHFAFLVVDADMGLVAGPRREIRSYVIDEENELLDPQLGPDRVFEFPAEQVLVHPSGQWLYASGISGGFGRVQRYLIGTYGEFVDSNADYGNGTRISALASSPTGNRLYAIVHEPSAGPAGSVAIQELEVAVDDGKLSANGFTEIAQGEPTALIVNGEGEQMYVRRADGDVDVYWLTPGTPGTYHRQTFPLADNQRAAAPQTTLAIDPSGRFIYATVPGSDVAEDARLTILEIASDGLLVGAPDQPLREMAVRTAPVSIAMAGSTAPVRMQTRSLYAPTGSTITQWKTNTSAPVDRGGDAVFDGEDAQRMLLAAHPWSRHLYVASDGFADPTYELWYDFDEGWLDWSGDTNTVQRMDSAIAVGASGRYAYVGANDETGAAGIERYSINGGALEEASPEVVWSGTDMVTQLLVDPTGRFMYGIYEGPASPRAALCEIDVDVGPDPCQDLSVALPAGNPLEMAMHPDGRALYLRFAGALGYYPLNVLTGKFDNALALTGHSVGDEPLAMALDPAGEYLYVALPDDRVRIYQLGNDVGSVHGLERQFDRPLTSPGTGQPIKLMVAADGQSLYVAYSDRVAAYKVIPPLSKTDPNDDLALPTLAASSIYQGPVEALRDLLLTRWIDDTGTVPPP